MYFQVRVKQDHLRIRGKRNYSKMKIQKIIEVIKSEEFAVMLPFFVVAVMFFGLFIYYLLER